MSVPVIFQGNVDSIKRLYNIFIKIMICLTCNIIKCIASDTVIPNVCIFDMIWRRKKNNSRINMVLLLYMHLSVSSLHFFFRGK